MKSPTIFAWRVFFGIAFVFGGVAVPARAAQFCNSGAITINDNAVATPYPSNITVSGLTGVVSSITVDLKGVSHTFPDDIQVLLVGPGGQKVSLMSNAGVGTAISNANLTFDDAAANYMPASAALSSGTFKPSSYGNTAPFPAPAPTTSTSSPYAKTLSTFLGQTPNGTWSLYVRDVSASGSGNIAGGWCLNITTAFGTQTCPAMLFQGSLAAGDSTQTGRISRNGITSLCSSGKAYPGTNDTTLGRRFDQYSITNNNATTQCVTASLTSGCSNTIFLVAYSGSYNPANIATNYLADNGTSQANTGPMMAFTLAPGATAVLVVHEVTANVGCASYGLLVEGKLCNPCTIACPANITVSNQPNQCGAVVNYPAPNITGTCGTTICTPASGSFYPKGVTTVTCTTAAGPSCSFTITVNDTQPPTISCPANITAQANPGQNSAVVNYPPPTVSDNCPGVSAAVCVPASGSSFPVGNTTVTCSTHDVPNNTAACSFSVTVNPAPTPTPTPTPPAPTPTPTPTPTPVTTLANISTRLRVETGDNALIGGFIITGTQPKKVIVRGIGTSLPLADKLVDPTLELHGPSGLIDANDNWMDSPNKQAIIDSTIPPSSDFESAIIQTVPANSTGYTAIVRGVNNSTGIGVVEAYDLDTSVDSRLANISTRGFVQTGDNVLIAGTIIVGQAPQNVLVRGIGPSLPIPGRMENPTLELRDSNGAVIKANDNWVDSPDKQAIIDTTIPPTNDLESAIIATLPSNTSSYTAILRGVNDTTGIAVVEVYALP